MEKRKENRRKTEGKQKENKRKKKEKGREGIKGRSPTKPSCEGNHLLSELNM
jgi:hypothetical protein